MKVHECQQFSSKSLIAEFLPNWGQWLGPHPFPRTSQPPLLLSLSLSLQALHRSPATLCFCSWNSCTEGFAFLHYFNFHLYQILSNCNWSAWNWVNVIFCLVLCRGESALSISSEGSHSCIIREVEILLVLVSLYVVWICNMFSLC